MTDFNWLLAGPSTATYGRQKDSRVYSSEQQAAVANQVLLIGLRTLNWPQSGKAQSQVQDQSSHEVQYSLHEKLSRFSLLPCCDSTQIYIPWIQTYIKYFNVHTPYLLYRCLKTFSVGMAHSVYLMGSGLQNRGCVGRFQKILKIFSSPKYSHRLWAHPTSLKWAINTVTP
jgi:hypothetical protein